MTCSRSPRGGLGVVQRKRESLSSMLPGHHGALTDEELLVPLLAAQPLIVAG